MSDDSNMEPVDVEGLDLGNAEPTVVGNLVEQLKGTQPVTDLLVNMYLRQLGHMREYDDISRAKGLRTLVPQDWGNLSDPRVQAKLRELGGYVVEELYEAINHLKNKPWKQTARETDAPAFYKEVADAWHFWLEFMIVAGMMPPEVAHFYFTIAESNDDRRVSGY